MHRKTLLTLMAVISVTAGFAVGCGDSGDGDEGDTGGSATAASGAAAESGSSSSDDSEPSQLDSKTISKASFIKRGNKICEVTVGRVTTQVAPVLQEVSDKDRIPTEEELIDSVFVPRLQAEVDQLADLGMPKGDRAQVEAILTAIQKSVDEAEADPAAAVAAKSDHYAEAARAADRYGLTGCPFG